MRKNKATAKAISTARVSIARRRSGRSWVNATNIGTTPGGSTTTSSVTKAVKPNLTMSWSITLLYSAQTLRFSVALCGVICLTIYLPQRDAEDAEITQSEALFKFGRASVTCAAGRSHRWRYLPDVRTRVESD